MSESVMIHPLGFSCRNYRPTPETEVKVSAIIVPICIEDKQEKKLISWACSKGHSCYNHECRYAFANQKIKSVAK